MYIVRYSLCCLLLFLFGKVTGQPGAAPHLAREGNRTRFMVDGKHFLMLGGETGNSSSSNTAYMATIWPKMKAMNFNTVLAPVYWELMEPEEGKFDFKLVDDLLDDARKNDIKLVLLWFGSWKNSMSCYAPGWVKTNTDKYERAVLKDGRKVEILSAFNKDNLAADIKAFSALMNHIKAKDSKEHTVIMIQVENEIGMLEAAREHTPTANKAYAQPLPAELKNYLEKNKSSLTPFMKKKLSSTNIKSGNWSSIFGNSLETEEMFQAWYYAKYADAVAAAGKKIYNIPMYVNAALNYKNVQPGDYPSAGPLPHLMDIWKAAAPSIDILSPDFYNPYFKQYNDQYTRDDNPLFIPEIRFDTTIAPKAFYAMGHYHSLGFSPFAFEATQSPEKEPIGNAYDVLHQIEHEYFKQENEIEGVLLDKKQPTEEIKMGNYLIKVSHDNTLSWSPRGKDSVWQFAGAMIIRTPKDEFLIAGSGVVLTFKTLDGKKTVGILEADEGRFEDGKWISQRRLNGDQTHQGRHINISFGRYGIQKFKLYTY